MVVVKTDESCLFCRIVAREVRATIVFEDEISLAFLDHRPLFLGHSLLIPKTHMETLGDLPSGLVGRFFQNVQTLSRAVEVGLKAEGSFVAMNNRISQSVPHLHVHIVPRRKKDGLKGFFWPRTKYQSEEEIEVTGNLIIKAISSLKD
jgi:histidine triad (HIT) family protein